MPTRGLNITMETLYPILCLLVHLFAKRDVALLSANKLSSPKEPARIFLKQNVFATVLKPMPQDFLPRKCKRCLDPAINSNLHK